MSLRYPPFDAVWYGAALHERDLGRLLCNGLLANVTERYVMRYRTFFQRTAVAPGTTVLYEGDEAQRVYLILRGRVLASRQGTETTLRARTFFGEQCLFSAVVDSQLTADCQCELASISRLRLRSLINEQPAIAMNIAHSFRCKLERTYEAVFARSQQRTGDDGS